MTNETNQQNIPGYQLKYSLGRGKTSAVRLAIDPKGRQVALKLPHPETLKEQDAAERFGNEVRLTLRFRHENIVRAYAGTAFGPEAFLALEYYPKGALSEQMLRRHNRPYSETEALRILADTASALTYLHKQDAVHQDVKTQNIYVQDGRAALGDLGNTYFLSQGCKASGSPFYMAPEIYKGDNSSSASDVYSLGIMMYELLAKQRPFIGESYDELMIAHLTKFAQPLTHLNSEVPRKIAILAEKALAKRSSERPEADTIRRALLESLGETAPEIVKEEDETNKPEAIPAPQGRHGTTGRLTYFNSKSEATTKNPEATTTESKGWRWNPFRRKK